MQPFTVGFLCPYSSIYPNFFPHLATGFYIGLGQVPGRSSDIVLLPEFAGSGGRNSFIEASRKLLQFTRVDMLSGMVSYRSAREISSLLTLNRKLAYFFDLGELFPLEKYRSPQIFGNSYQLYQSEYALGYWAQSEYKNPGLVLIPVYNAGFHLHRAFEFGVKHAGGSAILQSVIPYKPHSPHHLDIAYAFDIIRKEAPAFVHALFVGPQGNEFLLQWTQHSFTRNIPLLVAENMLYPDMLTDVWNLNLKLYGATLYEADGEQKQNRLFVKNFKSKTGQFPNMYALLGYEAGLLFKEMLHPIKKRQWDVIVDKMKSIVVEGPRGIQSFCRNQTQPATVHIVQTQTCSQGQKNIIISEGRSLGHHPDIEKINDDPLDSGWMNPYLCI